MSVESQEVRSLDQVFESEPVHGRVKLPSLVMVILGLSESKATGIDTEGEDLLTIHVQAKQTVRCAQRAHGAFKLIAGGGRGATGTQVYCAVDQQEDM